jgi:hypothetical protein
MATWNQSEESRLFLAQLAKPSVINFYHVYATALFFDQDVGEQRKPLAALSPRNRNPFTSQKILQEKFIVVVLQPHPYQRCW